MVALMACSAKPGYALSSAMARADTESGPEADRCGSSQVTRVPCGRCHLVARSYQRHPFGELIFSGLTTATNRSPQPIASAVLRHCVRATLGATTRWGRSRRFAAASAITVLPDPVGNPDTNTLSRRIEATTASISGSCQQ